MEILRQEFLKDLDQLDNLVDTTIPITLEKDGDNYSIYIDGVHWVTTTNQTHAVVMFVMMQENITDYMNYTKLS